MIVGTGDIASVLKEIDYDTHKLFFASGVSNSQEVRESEYDREYQLLLKQNRNKHLVYFSSLSVFYRTTRYTMHKKLMEDAVRSLFPLYTIVRIGNITWGDNPHTLINFLRDKIKHKQPFEVLDEYRYIVDKEEFLHWLSLIPEWKCEMNIPGRRMKVSEIVDTYGYIDIHTQ